MIDVSLLARLCTAEAPDLLVPVKISDLWQWTFERVERSPAAEALIDHWGQDRIWASKELRARYGVQATVIQMLTKGLERGLFALRLHDGHRAWRLPLTALPGSGTGARDLEMTWTRGRLWDWDVAPEFRPLVGYELLLQTTEDDAERYRRTLLQHIAEMEALPLEEIPSANPTRAAELAASLAGQKRWGLREALLWVACRDLGLMTEVMLTSVWVDDDIKHGIAGAVWAACDIQGQRWFRSFHTEEPDSPLLLALRNGNVPAIGMFEGREAPRPMEDYLWDALEFGVPPASQKDGSAAKRRDQVAGLPWRGHWAAIRLDREMLWRAFPPVVSSFVGDVQTPVEKRLREILAKEGVLTQARGEEVRQAEFPTAMSRCEVRQLVKRITGNGRRGPIAGANRIRLDRLRKEQIQPGTMLK